MAETLEAAIGAFVTDGKRLLEVVDASAAALVCVDAALDAPDPGGPAPELIRVTMRDLGRVDKDGEHLWRTVHQVACPAS